MHIKVKERIINSQFKTIGVNFTYQDMNKGPTVMIDGKAKNWWDVYKWESIEQYEKWREDSLALLEEEENPKAALDKIDMRWGINYRYKKSP